MNSLFWFLAIDVIMMAVPLLWMAHLIRTEIQHRRRMRELDEITRQGDFFGVMQWGEKYLKRKQ